MANNNQEEKKNNLGVDAETARNAATAARSLARAAAKGASGNVVGATVEVMKDKTLRYTILAIVFLPLVVIILVLSALPSMMFGAVIDFDVGSEDTLYGNVISDEITFDEAYNDIPVTSEKFNYLDLFASIITNYIKSVFGLGTGDEQITYEKYSFFVSGEETSAINTIKDQTKDIIDLFEKRRALYEKLLDEMKNSFLMDKPANLPEHDEFRVITLLTAPQVTESEAVQFMSAYAIQRGNGTDNVDTRSLLAWVGWTKKLSGWKTVPCFCYDRTFYTYRWDGDYLPQYLYEQLATQQKNEWPLSSYTPDSFLEKVYYVDPTDGITVTFEPSVESRYNHVLEEWYDVDVLTMNINMEITLKSSKQISDEVMGFWSGNLSNHAGGVNRTVEGVDPAFFTYEWEADGHTFTRLTGYQEEYMENHQETTRKYIGVSSFGSTEVDFSILGATESATQAGEHIVDIATRELGTVGGGKYSGDYSSAQPEWCAYFVLWCAKQAGLYQNGGVLSGVTPSCTATWRNYGGVCSNSSFSGGSTPKGTAIVVDDTTVGGGSYIPQRGDLVIFASTDKSTGQLVCGHIGIVESYDISTNDLITLEGNTGTGGSAAQRAVLVRNRTNGVKYGSYYKNYNIVGFIHPNYPADSTSDAAETPAA